jgi:UDP:flavonoid glycosyltransferase YjiC (YdhE family)
MIDLQTVIDLESAVRQDWANWPILADALEEYSLPVLAERIRYVGVGNRIPYRGLTPTGVLNLIRSVLSLCDYYARLPTIHG